MRFMDDDRVDRISAQIVIYIINGTVYGYFLDRPVFQNLYLELCVGNIVNRGKISR